MVDEVVDRRLKIPKTSCFIYGVKNHGQKMKNALKNHILSNPGWLYLSYLSETQECVHCSLSLSLSLSLTLSLSLSLSLFTKT